MVAVSLKKKKNAFRARIQAKHSNGCHCIMTARQESGLYRTVMYSLVCVLVCRILQKFVFFFFSSRRRHMRLQGDGCSDVCSSDLRVDVASRHCTHELNTALRESAGLVRK